MVRILTEGASSLAMVYPSLIYLPIRTPRRWCSGPGWARCPVRPPCTVALGCGEVRGSLCAVIRIGPFFPLLSFSPEEDIPPHMVLENGGQSTWSNKDVFLSIRNLSNRCCQEWSRCPFTRML